MERDRWTKVIAVVALVVAIVGLSLGFAAFTNQLTISSDTSSVNPSQDAFNVRFSTETGQIKTGTVSPTLNPSGGVPVEFTGNDATVTGERSITGIGGTFTAPGQTLTYEFYVGNPGEYDAYLKSIVYENAASSSTPIKCEAKDTTTPGLVAAACGGFELKVQVGDHTTVTGSDNSISEKKLAMGAYEKVIITITYKAEAPRADGDFDVKFGDIYLNYSSSDATA